MIIFVHIFIFVTLYPFYFLNYIFPHPNSASWSFYAILHIHSILFSSQYFHWSQIVYINHKTKWAVPSLMKVENHYIAWCTIRFEYVNIAKKKILNHLRFYFNYIWSTKCNTYIQSFKIINALLFFTQLVRIAWT